MRVIYDIATDEWLREVISDYEAFGISPDLYMQYGDQPLTERWEQGDWQLKESGIGWNLSMDIWGHLPGPMMEYQNAFLKVVADFGGILVPALDAPVSTPEEKPDYSTHILAGTPGVLADKMPLREPVEYIGRTPEWVIRDALYRIPYYDRGYLSIPPFDRPLIDRRLQEGDGFEDSAFPKNILDAMKDVLKCTYNDTPTNLGHTVGRDLGTGEGRPVVWTYSHDDDKQILEEFVNPAPASPDEQYTMVVCRDRFEDGSIRIWEQAEVDYSRLRYPPPPGRIMFVDFNATDDEGTLTAETARKRAVLEANALQRLIHYGSMTTSFNLFLEPTDVITLTSEREDDTGHYSLTWRAIIEGITHKFGGSETLTTQIDYRAVLMQEARIVEPKIFLPGVTAQVADTESIAG